MTPDPIVDEIRSIREKEAAKHGFDVKSILAAAKKRQQRTRRKVVSFAPQARANNSSHGRKRPA